MLYNRLTIYDILSVVKLLCVQKSCDITFVFIDTVRSTYNEYMKFLTRCLTDNFQSLSRNAPLSIKLLIFVVVH